MILEAPIEEELKKSYLEYAMSVIVSRALPDVRDGLKPVHRRILYSMYESGLWSDKPYKKSARVVGDVLGKYHPHGDAAVYDALVRMAQDFVMNYPLVDGQGNFGSVDGDPPAAMRYTEVRLSKIAEEMLEDLDKETVDFRPNFDNTLKEPTVLPAKFPNLIVNGTTGIAVGMATNIPPHNLNEIIDAILELLRNPELNDERLFEIIKGPDFPTGGIIYGTENIKKAYRTGKASITVRAKVSIEEDGKKKRIVITEIPYQTNKAKIVKDIATLVKEKKITKVTDIRDESDREGIRVVVELRHDADVDFILKYLYKHTDLQTTFGIQMLALVDGVPRLLSLKEILQEYIKHRKEIVTRRTQYLLKQAREREHILFGLLIALNDIDNVIAIIKKSKDKQEAAQKLMKKYDLTEIQANAILSMQLHRLTSLEQEKLKSERKELLAKIKEYEKILGSEEELLSVIERELIELKEKYGKPRKTQIKEKEVEIEAEELIPEQEIVVVVSKDHIYQISRENYEMRVKRGQLEGLFKGLRVKNVIYTNTKEKIYFITNKGKLWWEYGYNIPELDKNRGAYIKSLFRLSKGEEIVNVLTMKDGFLILVTKQGYVKKINVAEIKDLKKGTSIMQVKNDEVVDAIINGKEVMIFTKNGMSIRFTTEDIRESKRGSGGVLGIKLKENDEVIKLEIPKKYVITITEHGYVKCTEVSEYPVQNRGGVGVINIKTEKTGSVKHVLCSDTNEVLVIYKTKIQKEELQPVSRNSLGKKHENILSVIGI